MKKNNLIIMVLLAGAINFPCLAQEPVQESPKTRVGRVKAKIMNQWNQSIDRLKRCFQGQCSKMEALKAARDVSIAAVAVITAMYMSSFGLDEWRKHNFPKGTRVQVKPEFVTIFDKQKNKINIEGTVESVERDPRTGKLKAKIKKDSEGSKFAYWDLNELEVIK